MEGPGETGPVYPKRGTRGFPGRLPQVGQRAKQEGNQPIPSAAWLQKCKSRNPERRHHPLQRSESWKVEEISKCPLRFSCRARHFQDSKGTRTWRRSKGTIQFRVITACLSQVKDKHEPGAGGDTWRLGETGVLRAGPDAPHCLPVPCPMQLFQLSYICLIS